MSTCRLRSYDTSPPGGYPYTNPDGKVFMTQPIIEPQGQTVSAYRKANNQPRSSYAECIADVDRFQCARLGCNSAYCIQDASADSIALSPNAPGITPCKGCGSAV